MLYCADRGWDSRDTDIARVEFQLERDAVGTYVDVTKLDDFELKLYLEDVALELFQRGIDIGTVERAVENGFARHWDMLAEHEEEES